MRRGCISLGDISCDGCHCTIRYLERYLVSEESADVVSRLCLDCASAKGSVRERDDKGERIISFFPEEGGNKARL